MTKDEYIKIQMELYKEVAVSTARNVTSTEYSVYRAAESAVSRFKEIFPESLVVTE